MSRDRIYNADDMYPDCMKCDHCCGPDWYCDRCGPEHWWYYFQMTDKYITKFDKYASELTDEEREQWIKEEGFISWK